MRTFFLSFTAIAAALVLFAFTRPAPKAITADRYVFEFDGLTSGGYSIANVEDESNTHWKYVGMNEELCSDDPTRACRIAVTEDYVDNPSSPTALSGVTITAQESSTGIAYVSAITAPLLNEVTNKP
jgi:hypothetical protein